MSQETEQDRAEIAEPDTTDATTGDAVPTEGQEMVLEELLVEDVSIDGMCGVY